MNSISSTVSITFDLSSYNIESDGSNIMTFISSYSGSLRGTGGGISGYLSKEYDNSTKKLTVTRHSGSYMVNSNSSDIVVIIL